MVGLLRCRRPADAAAAGLGETSACGQWGRPAWWAARAGGTELAGGLGCRRARPSLWVACSGSAPTRRWVQPTRPSPWWEPRVGAESPSAGVTERTSVCPAPGGGAEAGLGAGSQEGHPECTSPLPCSSRPSVEGNASEEREGKSTPFLEGASTRAVCGGRGAAGAGRLRPWVCVGRRLSGRKHRHARVGRERGHAEDPGSAGRVRQASPRP